MRTTGSRRAPWAVLAALLAVAGFALGPAQGPGSAAAAAAEPPPVPVPAAASPSAPASPTPAAGEGSVSGTVAGAAGSGLAGIAVTLVPHGCDPACPQERTQRTADGGVYRADGVPAGSWLVRFSDPRDRYVAEWFDDAAARAHADPVLVSPGTTSSGVDAALQRGGLVAGTVRGPDGAAVAGARVSAGEVGALTQADGGYRLGPLPGGEHRLQVRPPAAWEPASRPVTVAVGDVVAADVRVDASTLPLRRVAGAGRIATAVAASREGWIRADTVVIAAAGVYPDALAGAPLAAALDAPLLLVGERTPPAVLEEIRRLGARSAVVIGAVGVVPFVVSAELVRAGLQVQRIAGDGRYDTAALVAREIGAPTGEALVASGADFADAVSAAALAAVLGWPVLLTDPAGVPPDTAAALEDLGVRRTWVVGGRQAVSDHVLDGLPQPQRLSGVDRYATAARLARFAVAQGVAVEHAVVATGRAFPDALAAGPLLARTGGVLLLVDGHDAAAAEPAYTFLVEHFADIGEVIVLGGEAAVSPGVARRAATPAGAVSP